MTYEGWIEDGGYWYFYDEPTELSSEFNAGIYFSQSGSLMLGLFIDDSSVIRFKLNDYFVDVNNPTKQELLMIQLQFGVDMTEPLILRGVNNEL